ncbi:MAG: ATP-binding cassette domain-containing protein [Clostridium sp.]
MIEIKNIYFEYVKDKPILDNIDFSFENNKVYGLVGRNGVGKSTLFECLVGLKKVKKGEVNINSIKYTNESYLKNPLVLLNNDKIFYSKLTVLEHLQLLKSYHTKINVEDILRKYNLEEYSYHMVNQLSLGTKQRLNIGIKLAVSDCDILADEPFNGLDLIESENLMRIFLESKNKNKSIIISSHDILSLTNVCDEIVFLKNGKLINININEITEMNKVHEFLQED